MHTDYLSAAIRQLRDQLIRCSAGEKRLEMVDQAEKLLNELDSGREYSFDCLCYRIARLRPQAQAEVMLTAQTAQHDLALLVEDLSESAAVPAAHAGQEVLTVEQLSKQFHVSTKTISRWRRQGLVSRRFVFDGRIRVGFLASSVERFVRKNHERIRRGAQFSQLTEEERARLIERARRLVQAGGCPSEVTKRLARWSGRNAETVRYTIRQFDRQNPHQAIFPDHTGPVREETQRRIYQQYRRGEPIESLARQFCRTKAGISRIIKEMRAKTILSLPLDYMPNEQFDKVHSEKQENEILGPAPPSEPLSRKSKAPAGVPAYLASLYEIPLLTPAQEVHLFRKMNYLKYKAARLREHLNPSRPKSGLMDQIERHYDESVAVKNAIVSANLRLVVSIAKRHVGPVEGFYELVSDGNVSLIRAVEKFDFARGNKFSTYASWALMKNFARTIPDALRCQGRFRTSQEAMLGAVADARNDPYEIEAAHLRRKAQIGKILKRLDEREQKIIVRRFGLGDASPPLTLKQVGAELGVSKERTRQLEARALNHLRKAMEEENFDVPEAAL